MVAKRIISLLLVCFILSNSIVFASAAEPRASDYLDSYNAYVYAAGGGEVQVWFSVTADNYMDTIGALSIEIYESTNNSTWTYKETFTHTECSGMLDTNDIYHSGHISYQGIVGRYYKAYVCIWAGNDNVGDTRYFWTSAKKAT